LATCRRPQALAIECDANAANTQTAQINTWLNAFGYATANDSCSIVNFEVTNYTTTTNECGAASNCNASFHAVNQYRINSTMYPASATDSCGNPGSAWWAPRSFSRRLP
jgi:hypothetical protein